MLVQNRFWQQVKFFRTQMTRAQRKRTRTRKPRGVNYPFNIEKQYQRAIIKIQNAFILCALDIIRPYLLTYVRKDSAETEWESIWQQLENELELYYGYTYAVAYNLGQVFTDIAEKVFGKHSAFMQQEVKVLTGGNTVPMDYSWWKDARLLWEQENYRLIKTMSTDYIAKLNSIVITGVQSGATYEDLLLQIESLSSKMTGFNARRLARDQIGKLNGIIAKEQQTSIGMETYYWHTMGDEKVRGDPTGIYAKAIPQHFYIDNMLCSWNNPSVYSDDLGKTWKNKPSTWVQTHPGMAIMCRCESFPSWSFYLHDIDKEIEGGV